MTMSDAATPDHALELVWLVECTYAPDAAETRVPVRAEHLARVAALRRSGVIVEAGAVTDVSRSVLVIRAESEHEALEVCRQDAYTREGVWVEFRARPFGRVRLAEEG